MSDTFDDPDGTQPDTTIPNNAPEASGTDTLGPVTLAVNVTGDQVGGGLGRAHTVAIAVIANGRIVSWEEHEVAWDVSHDQGPEGQHHARIVRFMRDNEIQAVVTGHMGPPMVNTLHKLGVLPLVNASGDVRDAALAGAAILAEQHLAQSEDDTAAPADGSSGTSASED